MKAPSPTIIANKAIVEDPIQGLPALRDFLAAIDAMRQCGSPAIEQFGSKALAFFKETAVSLGVPDAMVAATIEHN